MKNGNPSSTTIVKNGLLKGISIGAGIGIGLITTTLFAAAAAMKVFSAGEVISASELNRNLMIAGPEGEVSAFYLSQCPEGWAAADGSPGTPDLRGHFIRGLNDFGTGAVSVDPQGPRALGSVQTDAFQGHRHNMVNGNTGNTVGNNGVGLFLNYFTAPSMVGDPMSDGVNGAPRTSSETRPRNVALIYCVRKN